MLQQKILRLAAIGLLLPGLACAVLRQTPQPAATVEQLAFEIQTVTPTLTPVLYLVDVPTDTPDPNATSTPLLTSTTTVTAVLSATATPAPTAEVEAVQAPAPTETPVPAPVAEPLQGGAWDFEDGFTEWRNPYGDLCPGSGLADGWGAFTTRDQYGSSCFNQTTWKDNVYSGENAQEITFAYVGNQAGIFSPVATTPGHNYTVTAYMRREFSPAKVETALGIDVTGGVEWQAESVQWFPWREDVDDAWAKTEETVTATGDKMTIFIKGSHPYPEPGGTLRLDAISIIDLGPAP